MKLYFDLPINGDDVSCLAYEDELAEAAHAINCHDELVEALEVSQSHGCPICRGDCGSANPPVVSCPMQMASAILAKAKGTDQ